MDAVVTGPRRAKAARETPLVLVHYLPDDRVVQADTTESILQVSRRSGIPTPPCAGARPGAPPAG